MSKKNLLCKVGLHETKYVYSLQMDDYLIRVYECKVCKKHTYEKVNNDVINFKVLD